MIKQIIGQLLENDVVLHIEGIDRMYLNLYRPRFRTGAGVAAFFKLQKKA